MKPVRDLLGNQGALPPTRLLIIRFTWILSLIASFTILTKMDSSWQLIIWWVFLGLKKNYGSTTLSTAPEIPGRGKWAGQFCLTVMFWNPNVKGGNHFGEPWTKKTNRRLTASLTGPNFIPMPEFTWLVPTRPPILKSSPCAGVELPILVPSHYVHCPLADLEVQGTGAWHSERCPSRTISFTI